MKFGIPGVPWPKLDVNWLLGKAFGGIPWFQQWINGENQLMHFPDFSMFIPALGLPFLIGHIGKSLFPNSWFKSWPSGVSGGVNAITSALGVTGDKEKDDKAKDDAKTKVEKDAIGEALKKKNAAQKGSSKRYSQEEYDKMTADYKANPTSAGATKLNRYARGLKAQNQAEFGGTGEAFTLGDKTYQPGDKGYLEAINAAQSAMHGDNTQLSKLQTANQQGGAKAVIESISTTASYDKNETEVVTVPAPKTTVVDDVSGAGGGGNAPLVVGGGGEGGTDPYESLYKGG